MTKTYFAGNEIDCFSHAASGVSETTSSAHAGFTRGSIEITGAGWIQGYCIDTDDGTRKGFTGTVWAHARVNNINASAGVGGSIFSVLNTAGTHIARLLNASGFSSTSSQSKLQYWNGAAYVDVGVNTTISTGNTLDIQIVFHASAGSVRWFINELLIAEVTGLDTITMFGEASSIYLSTPNGGSVYRWGEAIMADFNTLGHTVRTRAPTGNGANTAWTGDYTNVDEIPYSDADLITTTGVGDLETFTAAALSATPANQSVKAVVVGARLRNDGGAAPQHAEAMLRLGGVDYATGFNLPETGLGYVGGVGIWQENPAGGIWSITDINNTEFGLKSAT